MSKGTSFISEICKYFKENDSTNHTNIFLRRFLCHKFTQIPTNNLRVESRGICVNLDDMR